MIEHHLLFIYQDGPNIRFATRRMKILRGQDIESYALKVADNPSNGAAAIKQNIKSRSAASASPNGGPGGNTASQYDICFSDSDEKRWILLELMDGVNWQFGPESPGVTRKINAREEDHGLRFVTGGGGSTPRIEETVPALTPAPPSNRCRIAYWGVAKRTKGDKRGFNLHVEFYEDWQDSKGVWRQRSMPTIFDPTVPDDGNQGIPPKP